MAHARKHVPTSRAAAAPRACTQCRDKKLIVLWVLKTVFEKFIVGMFLLSSKARVPKYQCWQHNFWLGFTLISNIIINIKCFHIIHASRKSYIEMLWNKSKIEIKLLFWGSPQPTLAWSQGHVGISAANRLIGEVVKSRRRPLLGPSPGWKRLLAIRHYANQPARPVWLLSWRPNFTST